MKRSQIPPIALGPCASCPATVVWAVSGTGTGRRMPIDVDETPEGSVRLTITGDAVMAYVVPAGLRFGKKDLHRPHHQTCPAANRHRKGPSRVPRRR